PLLPPTILASDPLLGVPSASPATAGSQPDEVDNVWDLDFDLDVNPDSALARDQASLEQVEATSGDAQDTPLELKLVNTAVNLLGAIPRVRAARERLQNALRVDSLTIIANPLPGQETFGIS